MLLDDKNDSFEMTDDELREVLGLVLNDVKRTPEDAQRVMTRVRATLKEQGAGHKWKARTASGGEC